MGCQHVGSRLTFVPTGSIPQQQYRLIKTAGEQATRESGGLDAVADSRTTCIRRSSGNRFAACSARFSSSIASSLR